MGLISIAIIFITISFMIFHLLVLFSIIPYHHIWGGKIKSRQEMYKKAVLAIGLFLILLLIIIDRNSNLPTMIPTLFYKGLLWIFSAIFAFSALANILSKNKMEKFIFAPLAGMLSVLCAVLSLTS